MERQTLRNIAVIVSVSLSTVVAIYAFDLWLWATLEARGSLYAPKIPIQDILFVEGVLIFLFGLLLFLGRGGISLITAGIARWAAAAKAIFGEAPSINEIYRKDVWKPKGFLRVALAMILAGVILLLLYALL